MAGAEDRVGRVLAYLDSTRVLGAQPLPPLLVRRLVMERDQLDSTALMTVKSRGGSSLRPDGVLRGNSGRRLLAKWEDTASSMEQAVEDLRKKTAAWTQLYYGK